MANSNRVTILKELISRSNLKEKDTVAISIKGKDILLIPESEDLKGVKVICIRKIDEKGRILLPSSIMEISSKWIPYLLDGQIYLTKDLSQWLLKA